MLATKDAAGSTLASPHWRRVRVSHSFQLPDGGSGSGFLYLDSRGVSGTAPEERISQRVNKFFSPVLRRAGRCHQIIGISATRFCTSRRRTPPHGLDHCLTFCGNLLDRRSGRPGGDTRQVRVLRSSRQRCSSASLAIRPRVVQSIATTRGHALVLLMEGIQVRLRPLAALHPGCTSGKHIAQLQLSQPEYS